MCKMRNLTENIRVAAINRITSSISSSKLKNAKTSVR